MPVSPPSPAPRRPPESPWTTAPRGAGWHHLPITTTWDGRASDVQAGVAFRLDDERLALWGGAMEAAPICPPGPVGASTDRLWESSVVELFLVTDGGYLEIELGPESRYLAYGFSAPRDRIASYSAIEAAPLCSGPAWASAVAFDRETVLPRALGPVRRLNAFAHLPGRRAAEELKHFAFHPLPGPRPDFHQPARFPSWPHR